MSSSGGLFEDKTKLDEYSTKIIQSSEIAKYADKNYMRNPVITVIDGSTVVIFYEIRWESPGSENDTALTGTNTVDIAYTVSTDAGMSFDTSTSYNYVGGKASGYQNSHGAPVVFYDKTYKKLVVVASAGIGLGVGSKNLGDGESKLEYSVASVDNGKVTGFDSWKEITVDLSTINSGSSVQFEQFGTHAAKGVVANNKLLLPVVLGKFVNENGSWGNSRWGYVLFEGSAQNSGTSYTFTKVSSANPVIMEINDGTKATRIVSGTSTSDYRYITVSDRGNPVKLYSGKGSTTPTKTSINAGDGAAGTLIVADWRGKTLYDPKTYAENFDKPQSAKSQALLSHVEVLEKQLAIRLVNEDFTTQQGSSFIPDAAYKNNSKSSSLDILKDGTIVMAAEGGQVKQGVEDGVKRPFYINFFRFTQAHITSETGN